MVACAAEGLRPSGNGRLALAVAPVGSGARAEHVRRFRGIAMMWAMVRKDVNGPTDQVRRGRYRHGSTLLVLCTLLTCGFAQELSAGGVPLPRTVRPGKLPAPAGTAPHDTPQALPAPATSRAARYAGRQQDLRQRLSTAARVNYTVDTEPAPPEGAPIMVDDAAPATPPVTPTQRTNLLPTPRAAEGGGVREQATRDSALEQTKPALPAQRSVAPVKHVHPVSTAGQASRATSAAPAAYQEPPPPANETPGFAPEPLAEAEDTAAEADSAAPALEAPPRVAPPSRTPTADNSPVFTEIPVEQDPDSPFEIIDQTGELSVTLRRSKLLRTRLNVFRTAVVDPSICDVIQFTPREVSIVGKAQGATTVTFWFEDDATHQPLTYLVRVTPDPEVPQRREEQYQVLQDLINGLFPDSKVRLTAVADKLLVQGQARDVEEAAQILAVIRGQAVVGNGGNGGGFGLIDGTAADPLVQEETGRRLPATQVVNMLRVPGEQQVALRVKIAELSRSAARRFGVDLDMSFADGNLLLESFLAAAGGSAPSVIGHFDGDQINFGIHYLERHGVVRLLSEPTLVTMSGQPASFVAGGEFAVPTVVGVGGAAAVTTDFRAFGAIITFLPVVLDKDRIRLQVSPEFSKINQALSVNNTPGLNTRAVATTVEMREGQTLAIAGLLDDSMDANLSGNVPFLYRVLGVRTVTRNETELLILVTPELVHPLDPEEVPPLPGFDVTEPTNWEFFAEGKLEGKPTLEYRSTVWPVLKQRYRSGGSAMISGPFGHGQ